MAHELSEPSRRGVLAGGALSATAAGAGARTIRPMIFSLAQIGADLERYAKFGDKCSGGEGDTACGGWLEAELKAIGYRVTRQVFDAPVFTARAATLRVGDKVASVIPQAFVVPTGPEGIEALLAVRAPWTTPEVRCDGLIALVVLPFKRWSSAVGADVRGPVDAAFAAGARAVVLVTTGPSREAVALNAPPERSLFAGPVAVLAPRDAAPFLAAAQRHDLARLTLSGAGGWRPAFNVVGRMDRGAGRRLVVSTPRSGWFTCAGERGGGIAAWVALLRWAPTALPRHDFTFLATSGHEYENQGGDRFMAELAPPPQETAMWLHLGANIAARDWNDLGPLRPLPSADSQRVLMVTRTLVEAAKRAFAGQPGLEQINIADRNTSAGELTNILSAGYDTVAGVFGSHRFHHVASDKLDCTAPEATLAAAIGFRDLVTSVLCT